jgi:hypothetical protein
MTITTIFGGSPRLSPSLKPPHSDGLPEVKLRNLVESERSPLFVRELSEKEGCYSDRREQCRIAFTMRHYASFCAFRDGEQPYNEEKHPHHRPKSDQENRVCLISVHTCRVSRLAE